MELNQDLRDKIEQACRVAEEFTKVYYENVDKKKHLMSKLYHDSGILVWNGNGTSGSEQIQKFFMDLPASEHTLLTLDAQPVLDQAVAGAPTFLIQVSGGVRFQDKQSKPFQQNFMITAIGDKWKIVSDCFRLQEPVTTLIDK